MPADLETYHPVSFRRPLCAAASAREPGDGAKLARAYADMVAEEAGKMRRRRKAKLVTDVADARGLIQHRVDRFLHANDILIDLGRHADRGLEQPEEVR